MTGRGLVACWRCLGLLAESRSGVTAIEYGLIAASIALAFLAIAILVGEDIVNLFVTVADSVNNAGGG